MRPCEFCATPTAAAPHGGKGLLTGLAVCGVCGETVHRGGGAHAGVPTYRCISGAHVARKSDPVDEYVTELTIARLTQPDAAELWTAELPDASELMAEADTLRRRRDDIAADYADGAMTASSSAPPTRACLNGWRARGSDRRGRVVVAAGDRRRRRCQSHLAGSIGCPAPQHHRRADDSGAAPAGPRHAHVSA